GGELPHAMPQWRPPATALRAMIPFDGPPTRGGLRVGLHGVPLGCERIHAAVTRCGGAAKGHRQLGALLSDDPPRAIVLLAPHLLLTGLGVAPGETAARLLAAGHRRLPSAAQAFAAA